MYLNSLHYTILLHIYTDSLIISTMALINDYFEKTKTLLKTYGSKSLVLMQVGSFFEVYAYRHIQTREVYGSCLDEFVRICDFAEPSVKSTKQTPKNSEILMSGFPEYMIDKYAARMQSHGYTCAIYRQDSNKKNTTRSLDIICSPGTYFANGADDSTSGALMDANTPSTNNIMCVWIHIRQKSRYCTQPQYIFGMSTIDVFHGSCNYNEYVEPNMQQPSCFDEVERYYSIHQPNEIIFVYDGSQLSDRTLESMVQYMQISSKVVHFVDHQNSTIDNSAHGEEITDLQKWAHQCSRQTYQQELLTHTYSQSQEMDLHIIFETCLFHEHYIGCQSFCFLLDFVQKHNPSLLRHMQLPTLEVSDQRLHLANHSLVQLNILDSKQHHGVLSSVEAFVTRSYTPMGRRLLKQTIVHPCTDVSWLLKEYSMIQHMLDHYDALEWIPTSLRSLHDIPYYYRKCVMNNMKPSDVYTLYKDLYECSIIYQQLGVSNDHTQNTMHQHDLLTHYCSMDENYPPLTELIKSFEFTFDMDVCKQYTSLNDIQRNIFVQGIYPEIDGIYASYREVSSQIIALQQYFSHIIRSETAKTKSNGRAVTGEPCKIHHTDKSGSYFKTSSSRAKLITNYMKHDKHKTVTYTTADAVSSKTFLLDTTIQISSATGSDKRIHSSQIDALFYSQLELKQQLQTAIQRQFKEVISSFATMHTHFYGVSDTIAKLDSVYHKARIAHKYNYCQPTIESSVDSTDIHSNDIDNVTPNQSSFVNAKQMRHILIEQLQQQEIYVPNDVSLGGDNSHEGMLLFGTNAVGKSSLIKALGICVVLAQSGFYVPCESFHYRPFKQLFTRILGNDNIFKGLSTFAVEMSELNTILRYSTENSLVLGDELCSGTEMGSAISIFSAGLMQLSNRHSKFIFATHFHEVTQMAQITTIPTLTMKHMSVVYDTSQDCLVYDRRLTDGPGNNNYGLEVCKSLNLPSDFLRLANDIRIQQQPETAPISMAKASSYNARKLRTNCEICQKACEEVHHLQHQKVANEKGFIKHFHKNHKANLINVCQECHDTFHNSKKQHKRVKTTKGMRVVEIQ